MARQIIRIGTRGGKIVGESFAHGKQTFHYQTKGGLLGAHQGHGGEAPTDDDDDTPFVWKALLGDPRMPPVGTILKVKAGGKVHEVHLTAKGALLDGVHHATLSAAQHVIRPSSKWSAWKFFGLMEPWAGKSGGDAPADAPAAPSAPPEPAAPVPVAPEPAAPQEAPEEPPPPPAKPAKPKKAKAAKAPATADTPVPDAPQASGWDAWKAKHPELTVTDLQSGTGLHTAANFAGYNVMGDWAHPDDWADEAKAAAQAIIADLPGAKFSAMATATTADMGDPVGLFVLQTPDGGWAMVAVPVPEADAEDEDDAPPPVEPPPLVVPGPDHDWTGWEAEAAAQGYGIAVGHKPAAVEGWMAKHPAPVSFVTKQVEASGGKVLSVVPLHKTNDPTFTSTHLAVSMTGGPAPKGMVMVIPMPDAVAVPAPAPADAYVKVLDVTLGLSPAQAVEQAGHKVAVPPGMSVASVGMAHGSTAAGKAAIKAAEAAGANPSASDVAIPLEGGGYAVVSYGKGKAEKVYVIGAGGATPPAPAAQHPAPKSLAPSAPPAPLEHVVQAKPYGWLAKVSGTHPKYGYTRDFIHETSKHKSDGQTAHVFHVKEPGLYQQNESGKAQDGTKRWMVVWHDNATGTLKRKEVPTERAQAIAKMLDAGHDFEYARAHSLMKPGVAPAAPTVHPVTLPSPVAAAVAEAPKVVQTAPAPKPPKAEPPPAPKPPAPATGSPTGPIEARPPLVGDHDAGKAEAALKAVQVHTRQQSSKGVFGGYFLKDAAGGRIGIHKPFKHSHTIKRPNLKGRTLGKREIANYEISKITGVRLVPPVVSFTDAERGAGTLMQFAVGYKDGWNSMDPALLDPEEAAGAMFHDMLAGNEDREDANFMVSEQPGPNGKHHLALIDNGMSLAPWSYVTRPLTPIQPVQAVAEKTPEGRAAVTRLVKGITKAKAKALRQAVETHLGPTEGPEAASAMILRLNAMVDAVAAGKHVTASLVRAVQAVGNSEAAGEAAAKAQQAVMEQTWKALLAKLPD